jgi:hypothetical protein
MMSDVVALAESMDCPILAELGPRLGAYVYRLPQSRLVAHNIQRLLFGNNFGFFPDIWFVFLGKGSLLPVRSTQCFICMAPSPF